MNVFQTLGRGILSPLRFIREVITELRLVTWPTARQTVRSTLLVVMSSAVIGIYIAILDFGFSKGIEQLLTLAR